MSSAAEIALNHIQRLLAGDPMLRDILAQAVPGFSADAGFTPSVDVFACDDHHQVVMDLPGVDRAQIKIRLDGAHLVVEGQRALTPPPDAQVVAQERGQGSFRRRFLLPENISPEDVSATFEDGILTVKVPHAVVSSPSRDIPISD